MTRVGLNDRKELMTLPVSGGDGVAHCFLSRTLAFAIDNSEEARSAFSWASANLIQGNDLVLLIHVHQKTSADSNKKKIESLRSKVFARFEECCRRNKWNCRTIIVDGDPVTQIAELTQKHDCDLCILGMKSKHGLLMARHRCIASEMARLCTCPVMIVKKPKVCRCPPHDPYTFPLPPAANESFTQ
jgi:nucleotide-binding universal stress UspA family protein